MQRGAQSPAGPSAAPFSGGLPETLDGMISKADLGLGPDVSRHIRAAGRRAREDGLSTLTQCVDIAAM